MIKNILLSGILIIFISCTPAGKGKFNYRQDFKPDSSSLKDTTVRLVFDDVREELRLGGYAGIKPNWRLTDNGIKVINSRRNEVIRRKKLIQDIYQGGKDYATIRDLRVPWFTLSMGDLNWFNYIVSTTLKLDKKSIAGIAFRYLNSREYYAFLVDAEKGEAKLVLRKIGQEATADCLAWEELQTIRYNVLPDKLYKIKAEVDGDNIECSIDNSVVIYFTDTYRKTGKIALIAGEPVEFGEVIVRGQMLITEKSIPREFTKPKLVYELPLPGENIPFNLIGKSQREFFFLDPDTDGEREIIIADRERYSYRCIEFDGTELWKIDDIKYPITEGGDCTIQVFDIDGDGKNEVITSINFQLQVRDGKTGQIIKSVSTPDPYRYANSRNYEYPKVLGDQICPVKIDPVKPAGFYIKDLYTNIWLFDYNLKQLWHKPLDTGHFPLPVDVDGDGKEEILVCHTLLNADGSVIWELPLEDHVDNIAYTSLNPGKEPKYFYLAAGESGLLKVDPSNGEILKRLQYGHIQYITIADFLPEKEGLELLTQTLWREDRIHYLFDKDLNMVSTWQTDFGRVYPIPWGINCSELALTNEGILDPLTGEVLHSSMGRILDVFADSRWGNVLVVTEEDNRINIYSSSTDSELEPVNFLKTELQSHYLAVIKKY
jgi:hypothetical protein